MTDNSRYYYSLNFSLSSIFLMLTLMALLLNTTINTNSVLGWVVYSVFAVIFLFLITALTFRRLIPALRGQTALELDEHGLNDYIRDVCINWKDIEQINLKRGRSAATINIDLKWESEYGSRISIPLRWVKGKDDDVFNEVIAYYEQNKATIY